MVTTGTFGRYVIGLLVIAPTLLVFVWFVLRKDPDYFTPLSDSEVPGKYQHLVLLWRKLAALLGYEGPIAWRVRAGFTLKKHAPKAGPCCQRFRYLRDWKLQNNKPTKDLIVFWIPILIPGSFDKTEENQLALLASLREEVGLPAHHLSCFGGASLLVGLVLAHFKLTGELIPLNQFWTRTDTSHTEDGHRLFLSVFDSCVFVWDKWLWEDSGDGHLGCFLLGVEEEPGS